MIDRSKADFRKSVKNCKFISISRKGKYLVFKFDKPLWMIVHLRMTGKFVLEADRKEDQYSRVIYKLDNGTQVIFHDVRCFGTIELSTNIHKHKKLLSLGWDPWDKAFTAESLAEKLQSKTTSIKSILLNQSIIAGLGNIYASEILFDAKINPTRKAGCLKLIQLQQIINSTKKILALALKKNGTTISDYRRVDDKQGTFQNFLKVYGKQGEPCKVCNNPIQKIIQNQRSTFLCETCQR